MGIETVCISIRQKHFCRAIAGIVVLLVVLITEPKRQPAPIRTLLIVQKLKPFFDRPLDPRLKFWFGQRPLDLRFPRNQRPQNMSRDIGSTAIERKPSPAATKRGPTTIPILQVQQPANPFASRLNDFLFPRIVKLDLFVQIRQRQQGTGRIVRVGNASR